MGLLSFLVGISISVVGSIVSNAGVNVQKYSQMQEALKPKDKQRKYLKQPYWQIGICGVIFGALCDFSALRFAPQAVIMPVGSVTLVANIFFAHFWLKEELTKMDILGTILIVIGAVLCALSFSAFSKTGEIAQKYDIPGLLDLYKDWYTGGFFMVQILMLAFFIHVKHRCSKLLSKPGGEKTKEYNRLRKLHPVAFAAEAGMFGALSVLFAKSISESITEHPWKYLYFYFLFPMLIFTVLIQTDTLTIGLKYFDALFIVPVFQCFLVVFSVLGGGIYWKEMTHFDGTQYAVFHAGIFFIIVGILLLSLRDVNTNRFIEDEVVEISDLRATESEVELKIRATESGEVEVKIEPKSNKKKVGIVNKKKVGIVNEMKRDAKKSARAFCLLNKPILRRESLEKTSKIGSLGVLKESTNAVEVPMGFNPIVIQSGKATGVHETNDDILAFGAAKVASNMHRRFSEFVGKKQRNLKGKNETINSKGGVAPDSDFDDLKKEAK